MCIAYSIIIAKARMMIVNALSRASHAAETHGAAPAAWTRQCDGAGGLQHGRRRYLRDDGLHGLRAGRRQADPGGLVRGGAVRLRRRAQLLRARHQLPQLRRRVRLSDASLRSCLGIYDRLGLLFRRLFRADRDRGPDLFQLCRQILPRVQLLKHDVHDRLGRAFAPIRRSATARLRADRKLHDPELLRRRARRQNSECADGVQDSGHRRPGGVRIRNGLGKLGQLLRAGDPGFDAPSGGRVHDSASIRDGGL